MPQDNRRHVANALRLLAQNIDRGHVPATTCTISQLPDRSNQIHIMLDFKANEAALQAFVTKLLVSGALPMGNQRRNL